jgi:hypothetical protein
MVEFHSCGPKIKKWNPRDPKRICHDCSVKEGEIHSYGCDMERCPFCSYQLISCSCSYKLLGLIDGEKYTDATSFLPPKIYYKGLSKKQEEKWLKLLNEKGRIPYIIYPGMCAKCGEIWPDMFNVSDEEWNKYVQPDMRGEMLCWKCYQYIKAVIDKANPQKAQPNASFDALVDAVTVKAKEKEIRKSNA